MACNEDANLITGYYKWSEFSKDLKYEEYNELLLTLRQSS